MLSLATNWVTRSFVGTPEQQEQREQKRKLAKLLTEKLGLGVENIAGRLAKIIVENGFPIDDILTQLNTLSFNGEGESPYDDSIMEDYRKVLVGVLKNNNSVHSFQKWIKGGGIVELSDQYTKISNFLDKIFQHKSIAGDTRLYIQAFLKAGYSLNEIAKLLKDSNNKAVLLAPDFVKNIAQGSMADDFYKSNIESALESAKSQKEQAQSGIVRQKEKEVYISFKLGQVEYPNVVRNKQTVYNMPVYESLEKIKYSLDRMLGLSPAWSIDTKLEKTIDNIATVLDRDIQYRSANNYYEGSEQQRLKTQIDSFLELVNNVAFLMRQLGIKTQYADTQSTSYTSNLPFPPNDGFMREFKRRSGANFDWERTLKEDLTLLTLLLQKNKKILEKQWDDQQLQANRNMLEKQWSNPNQPTINSTRITSATGY